MAFEGWNDAADAASGAVAYLSRALRARKVGHLDPEDFYDFTETRPEVRSGGRAGQRIRWPEVRLAAAQVPSGDRDLLLMWGPEPNLRWRSFTAAVLRVARETEVELAVSLGALLADVPHSRPVRVTGAAPNRELAQRLGVQRSKYEGPTGILGVLGEALTGAGIPSVSLWANVPHYVPQSPSPKATLALVERVSRLTDVTVDILELQLAAAAYERQVNELVAADEDVAAYVGRLEDDAAQSEGSSDEAAAEQARVTEPSPREMERLAADVERFLKDQGPSQS